MKQVNLQVPVKAERRDDGSLLIHSIFRTIQGEGPHVGEPSIFVRLGGCNLQCPGCDTEYTEGNKVIQTDLLVCELLSMVAQHYKHMPLIVVTGGEPFRQNIVPFINTAIHCGLRVQIETNGTLGVDAIKLSKEAWRSLEIVVSPKAGKVHESLFPFIIAYKYVANAGSIDPADGLPTTVLGLPGRIARPHSGDKYQIYLQPADELDIVLNKKNTDAVIASCQKHGHILCLQTHKFVGLE